MVGSEVLRKGVSQLIEVMYSRLPAGKTVTLAVVKQLLQQRYSDKFSSEFLEEQSSFIESEMARCAAKFQSKKEPTATPSSDHSDSSSEEEEEEEESDDEDEENSDEEDEEDEEDSSVEDSSTDESSENAEKDNHDNPSASDDPKKSRKREREGDDAPPAEANDASKDSTMAIVGMTRCLKKLRYPCRDRLPEESSEQYQSYITQQFIKHKLDPQQYDDKAIKRYNMLREVELLQEDGAKLQLDRSKRLGRGYSANLSHANTEDEASPPPAKFVSSKFLDDE